MQNINQFVCETFWSQTVLYETGKTEKCDVWKIWHVTQKRWYLWYLYLLTDGHTKTCLCWEFDMLFTEYIGGISGWLNSNSSIISNIFIFAFDLMWDVIRLNEGARLEQNNLSSIFSVGWSKFLYDFKQFIFNRIQSRCLPSLVCCSLIWRYGIIA